MRDRRTYLALATLATLAGCGGQPQAPAFPRIDPQAAATDAVRLYDRNDDGLLDADELAESPPLAASVKRLDKDGDGAVSAGEIRGRIEEWLNSGASLVGAIAQVTLDGAPLGGAEVTVEPEPFLGAAYAPATSRTDADGVATFTGHDPRLPGLHLGYYRVRISRRTDAGEESLPTRYNSQTELGVEVAGDKSNLSLFTLNGR